MKKILKIIGIILLVLILLAVIIGFINNKPLPKGKTGPAAEALAEKMMNAVNKTAWDTTHIVQWSFMGMHDFLWDKKREMVQVSWGNKKVLLDQFSVTGKAWVDGQEVQGEDANKLVQQAWSFFCNDSFWLNAVVKAKDPGTERSIVTLDNGDEALMVTYTSGGVTPGDSYMWILDEKGLPKAWQMWVNIIPVGGIETSWENWKTLPTGAKVAQTHKNGVKDLVIDNIQSGQSFEELGITGDPFEPILK